MEIMNIELGKRRTVQKKSKQDDKNINKRIKILKPGNISNKKDQP